ncbi:transferase family protein [Aspergillus puulaauensis]|uniref:Transferase family-domain-containing protein n=1 Tax=Aspergillus puulaauensis TaxID=1220207 RepID=A0A7R7XJH7_9EURO|nr:uncharacterized protein APUU_30353A [Aspergillus puulaauensis]BCS22128.1 hypothetical protein APUU_30353A [Aspergillus puulaauensis]
MVQVEVVESSLIFPTQKQRKTTVPLSILDAVVTNFAPTTAVWFFDAPIRNSVHLNWPSTLQESLRVTLSSFPHFAGELSKVENVPGGNHTQRFGRLQVTFGASADPGVDFSIARCAAALNEVVSSPAQRKSRDSQPWNLSCSAKAFLPDLSRSFRVQGDPKPKSPVSIRITEFGCGGVSVGVKISHPLADAQTLAVFMHRWSYEHTLLFCDQLATMSQPPGGSFNLEPPTFDPQLLDTRAAGDIDATSPDETLLTKSRSLPSSRYDWFWPAPDGDPGQNLPQGLTRSMVKSPGTPMPTADWDPSAPVSHTKLHISAAQIKRISELAGPSTSRHDAIVAHFWSAINRARGWGADERDVSLHISIGLRRRLGLPSSFLGSPILLTSVSMAGKDACQLAVRDVAGKINENLSLYTEEALKAQLHDLCFECAPQRFWAAYLGARHTIFTSWAHLNLYEVDFGGGRGNPRLVEPYMPVYDGILCLMEGRPEGKREHWCDDGVDVMVSLATDAVERLKADLHL